MIQKFSGILHASYLYSDQFSDLPDSLLKQIDKALAIDWMKEAFIAGCWIENFLSKGQIFLLITDHRVVFRDPSKVRQNLFKDMTGVERNAHQNITLLSPGNPNKLFPSNAVPKEKLMNILFELINTTWIKVRHSAAAAASATAPAGGITAQIEQLAELKQKGILTEEEFQKKKTELLSKM